MKNFILKNLFSIFGEKKKEQLRVITFHNILREEHDKFYNLIQYLKKDWNIISPDQFKDIINSKEMKTSKKNILITFDDAFKSQKNYYHYTGYPGGLKTKSFGKMVEDSPEKIIEKAVKGMLPKNKLSNQIIRKLKVYSGTEHPHSGQKPKELKI